MPVQTCRTWISTFGTLRYATADALEAGLGPELRVAPSASLAGVALRTALLQRATPVEVTVKVCRTWCDKYRIGATPSRKRPAAAPASDIHKRQKLSPTEGSRHAPTAYKLQKALADRTPAIHASESALKLRDVEPSIASG